MSLETTRDVSIIGGSVAGLLAGRELAASGLDVTIYEEHKEIGVPEKCDGLVSSDGISELGVVPPSGVIQNHLKKARFFSPDMKEIVIRAEKQGVIVMDRSRFDKYLAELAAKKGAKIEVGKRVAKVEQSETKVSFKVDSEMIVSKTLIDCGGYESYLSRGGRAFQGGQYLVYGNWFQKETVEVYIDPVEYPGFFKWVIPLSSDTAKIGVAGEGINTFATLDKFAKEKNATVFRKMAAPVLCFGAEKSFVDRRILRAGDAAGQAKPTTGGGIFTGGFGGVLAGRSVARGIKENDFTLFSEYERDWKERFGKEFHIQLLARSSFSKMSRDQINKLFEMVASSDIPNKISEEGDFDKHSTAIVKAFGITNVVSTFGMFFANELRDLVGR
ncbi:MAG: NAD(P)/FAD-dependent oxidoreductase [Nitrososphaerales archaeon]